MSKEILCTLGPASLNEGVLTRMNELAITLLRINMSHTSVDDLPDIIRFIKKISDKSICIDTEGAQIRTGKMVDGLITLSEGSFLEIHRKRILGNSHQINLYPMNIINEMQIFDLLSIDFNSALIQIVEKNKEFLKARVITEGKVGDNKGVSVNRRMKMDTLTEKDREAIKIAHKLEVDHFALSFANHVDDVIELRNLVGDQAFIISKIESHEGTLQLESIAKESDAILIDRGDLSREEPLEIIPLLQKNIIQTAKKLKVKVYVATNLLESMVEKTTPSRAEVSDVLNTLIDGADGLVLAAETAIGKNPVGCVNMVSKLIHEFENYSQHGIQTENYDRRSLLIDPHGGYLINSWLKNPDLTEIEKLPALVVDEHTLLDCEQIASGVYSPLQGFMLKEEMESVLDHNRLPNGIAWTLPILLQTQKENIANIEKGDTIALTSLRSRKRFALLHLKDIFLLEFESVARRMYGTTSLDHPGVSHLKNSGDIFLGGRIELFKELAKAPYIASYNLKPSDTRLIFEARHWYRIIGFHTRNIIHCAHEFIQLQALKDYHCDGLLISPVVGPKKKNDFKDIAILKAYQTMIDFRLYPRNKVLIGAFQTWPRYAGPREAVFTALCRKNFGCSHFILGRDHTGVKDFYPPEALIRIFDKIGDIGIRPIFFDEVTFCEKCKSHQFSCQHEASSIRQISGTRIRSLLQSGDKLPTWMVREEISDMLRQMIKDGDSITVE